MAPMPSQQEVLAKIDALYGEASTRAVRDEADHWLQDIRRHPQAWDIVNVLLTTQTKHEYQMFAAHAMAWRVRNEKPQNELAVQLQNCIVGHLVRLSEAGAQFSLLETLSMALVNLVLWNPSPQLVADMCTQMQGPQHINVLVLFLLTLGDEAAYVLEDLSRGRAGPADEPEVTDEHPLLVSVRPNCERVLGLLQSAWLALQDKSSRLAGFLLKAFGRWIHFGASDEAVGRSPVSLDAFNCMKIDSVSREAISLITDLSNFNQDKAGCAPVVSNLLSSQVMGLAQYLSALRDDEETAKVVACALFRTLRSFAHQIVTDPNMGPQILSVAVQALRGCDQAVFLESDSFWRAVSDEALIEWRTDVSGGEAVRPQLQEMVPLLVEMGRFPSGCESVPRTSPKHTEFISEFRDREFHDIASDIGIMLGYDLFVTLMLPQYQQCFNNPAQWATAESILALAVVATKERKASMLHPLSQLLQSTPALQQSHWRLKQTALELVAVAADGVLDKPEGAALLPAQVSFVLGCFDAECLETALYALKAICLHCTSTMVDHFGELEMRLSGLYGQLTAGELGQTLASLAALSCELPEAQMAGSVERMCVPLKEKIAVNMADPDQLLRALEITNSVLTSVQETYNAWHTAKENLSQQEILERQWGRAFGFLWKEVLREVVTRHAGNDRVMESAAGIVRLALLTTRVQFTPLLEDVIRCMIDSFKQVPQSAILWMMTSIVTVFGEMENYLDAIMNVLNELTALATQVLAKNPVGQNSDLITEIFYMLRMALRRFPVKLLQSQLAHGVLGLALASLTNAEVKEEAVLFVLHFFRLATEPKFAHTEHTRKLLEGQEGQLIQAMVHACVYRELEVSDKVAEQLLYFRAIYGEGMLPWLHGALAALPEDVPVSARQRCFDEFRGSEAGKDKMMRIFERLHRAAPKNWR